VPQLVERVWPGERMLAEAGADRVYAAISMLRKHAPGVVVREGDGYRIAPGLDVAIATDAYPARA
jgi:hypothetical protein